MTGPLARLRYRRLLARMMGPRLLEAFAEAYPEAVFVEIGANDGEQHDHLRNHILSRPWRGIMVEPVPYVFERLSRNYAGQDGVVLERAAVGDRDGVRTFWCLAEPEPGEQVPSWYDGVGSFSRDAVLRHADSIPDVERRLRSIEVPTVTFATLLARHGLDRVDLVLVDTEGHDWEVIRHIDLARHHPRLLVYEHFHLSAHDRSACREQLERAGYATREEGFDTFCLDTGPDDPLTARWHALRPAVPGVSKQGV